MLTQEEKEILLGLLRQPMAIKGTPQQIMNAAQKMDDLAKKVEAMPVEQAPEEPKEVKAKKK